ncbi:MAG: M20/M25/M40 family metallo-hydrolase [Acidobacteriota bacterium]
MSTSDFPRLTPPPVFSRALELLEAMVSISSPSGDRSGLEAVTRLYGDRLAELGLAVTIEPEGDDALPVLDARSPAAGESGYLLAVGHIDTVLPAGPVKRTGRRLVATGSVDMKAGLVALAGALDLLRSAGRRGGEDLRVAVVPDEEIAGPLSHQVVRALGPGARGLWSLEPGRTISEAAGDGAPDDAPSEREDGETLVIGRRGMLWWGLDIHGRSAHAGTSFWQGRSAAGAAAAWWLGAEALIGHGDGPTLNAGRMVVGEHGFVDDLAGSADLLFSQRQLNVVPDRARLEGEARFLRAGEADALRDALETLTHEIADQRGVRMELDVGGLVPPLDPAGPSHTWAERAAAHAARRGWRLVAEEDRRGISFPNFLKDPSTVPILDGLGPVGGGMHTRAEWVDLPSLDRRIALLADLLEEDAG